MNINRKTFIGGLVAGIATQLFGCNKSEFDDIRVDRYYVLIGKNRVPEGCPGCDAGKYLIEDLKYEANFRPIEEVIDEVEEAPEEKARHIKGVTYDKSRNKWVARISINGKRIYLGRFDTIAEAEKARKEAEENLK